MKPRTFCVCVLSALFATISSSPLPVSEQDSSIEQLASDVIDVMIKYPLDKQVQTEAGAALKRQDTNETLSNVVKRQLSDGYDDLSNMTSEVMVKRGNVLSLEVVELTTRQLEEALVNDSVLLTVTKRQIIQDQVLKNRQLINQTLESVKRQMSENVTFAVIVVSRQDLNNSVVSKRQELNNTMIVFKRQDLNDSDIFKRQDLNGSEIFKRQDLNGSEIFKRQDLNGSEIFKRQDLNDSLISKRQDTNDSIIVKRQDSNETLVLKRQDLDNASIPVESRSALIGEWLALTERQINETTGVNVEIRSMAANSLAQVLDLPSSGLNLDIDYSKVKQLVTDSAGDIKDKSLTQGQAIFSGIWNSLRKQFSASGDDDVWFDSMADGIEEWEFNDVIDDDNDY
ncbi:uncharacterized protein LOC142354404 isoform X2 [Convolutriloba macropyga]|uniref:uncharacterized protein LOC142354404 isoform X2 n=1 Tax=Convolutriloba macropyga TaxID=536237 RepID=UPI003F526645